MAINGRQQCLWRAVDEDGDVLDILVQSRRNNNRAEVSHQPTRLRERQMRRFKSPAHLQRFAAIHGVVQNLFRVARHLLRAALPPAPHAGIRRMGRDDVCR